MLRVLDVIYNIFLTPVLGRFFHGSGSRLFRIGSGFLADPDLGEKTGSETLPEIVIFVLTYRSL